VIVCNTIESFREARQHLGPLAFVPTMGALHAGHMSLVKIAQSHAPTVAVSIFVNPTQFGPKEDFSRYPRPVEADLALCEAAGVQLVFHPDLDQMYPADAARLQSDLPALTRTLEGASRPTHFQGVIEVVTKLFNIVQPQTACFGEKDFQQLAVIRAMTRAMNMPVEIVACPTLRDPDGLAMSSRNRYLSPDERLRALCISRALFEVQKRAAADRNVASLDSILRERLDDPSSDVPFVLDYAVIVDASTLAPIDRIDRPARALVAAKVGSTRLIDNVALGD
jgi:pantoate--beta-alanine ligase